MNERLKQIRLEHKMSQEEFGRKIGIESRAHISALENGGRNITDRIVNDVCREFNVNENWLRTGEGDPTIKRTRKQEIGAFFNEVMNLPDKNIKNRLLNALVKLDERDWETIAKIADNVKEGS